MGYKILPITEYSAQEIATWQHPPPYTIYSLSNEVIPILINPSKRYFAVFDDSESLVGYCCFGEEAQVMGGDYGEMDESVLDIGVGLRPERAGKGHGKVFVSAILSLARARYKPERFRVTVAQFNKRSLRTFQSFGFVETLRFKRPGDELSFIQLESESD